VGMGTHAELLARTARSFHGIDLTQTAIDGTTKRFQLAGLDPAGLQRMDAEHLDFPDGSFDLVWSWGVIHHSSDPARILAEIRRVLRPGGRAVTMVYHRNVWNWEIIGGFFHGVLRGQWLKHRSIHSIMQQASDGGLARYYTGAEFRTMAAELFPRVSFHVYGDKAELLPIPGGRIKSRILAAIPDQASRFFGNRLRMGRFLVAEMFR
jgi:ubiquinone/menaquinone biosynthesis C-methylase UbiE